MRRGDREVQVRGSCFKRLHCRTRDCTTNVGKPLREAWIQPVKRLLAEAADLGNSRGSLDPPRTRENQPGPCETPGRACFGSAGRDQTSTSSDILESEAQRRLRSIAHAVPPVHASAGLCNVQRLTCVCELDFARVTPLRVQTAWRRKCWRRSFSPHVPASLALARAKARLGECHRCGVVETGPDPAM
jgi:hypothetical protein